MTNNKIYAALAVLFLFACTKEKVDFSKTSNDIYLDPEVGVPVAYGEISLAKLVAEGQNADDYSILHTYQKEGDDDTMCVKLVKVVDSTVTPYDLIDIPDVDEDFIIDSLNLIDLPAQEGGTVIKFTKFMEGFSENPQDGETIPSSGYVQDEDLLQEFPVFEDIKWAHFSHGVCKLTFTNNYSFPVEFELDLESEGADFPTISFMGANYLAPGATVEKYLDLNNQRLTFWGEENGTVVPKTFFRLKNRTINQVNPELSAKVNRSELITVNAEVFHSINDPQRGPIADEGEAKVPEQFLADTTLGFYTVNVKDDDVKLHHIRIKEGELKIKFESKKLRDNISLKVEFPSMTDASGESFVETFKIISGESIDQLISLDQLTMDLQQNPKQRWNSFPYRFSYSINSGDNLIYFHKDMEISVNLLTTEESDDGDPLIKLRFEYVDGHLGYKSESFLEDVFDFELDEYLEMRESGTVKFTDPKIHIDLYNSLGINGAAFIQMDAKGMDKGSSARLFTEGEKRYLIKGPLFEDRFSNDLIRHTPIYVDRENSDIVNFMSILPEHVDITGYANLNDDEEVKNIPQDQTINFMYDTSSLRAVVRAEIPLEMEIESLVLADEFDFPDLPFEDQSEIQRMTILLSDTNYFPYDIETQIKFVDDYGEVIYQMDSVKIMAAGVVDDPVVGKTVQPTPHELKIELDRDNSDDVYALDNIDRVTETQFRIKIKTYDQKNITLYTYYTYKFKLKVLGKIEYEIAE